MTIYFLLLIKFLIFLINSYFGTSLGANQTNFYNKNKYLFKLKILATMLPFLNFILLWLRQSHRFLSTFYIPFIDYYYIYCIILFFFDSLFYFFEFRPSFLLKLKKTFDFKFLTAACSLNQENKNVCSLCLKEFFFFFR